MGFLKGKKNKEKTVAIFDIGSGSIGGAIVRIPIEGEGIPSIIKSTRTEIAYSKDKLSSAIFTKSMLKAFSSTVSSLYHTKSGAPNKVICVLASPWYSSETRIVKIKKESPFIFTKKLAEELLKKETDNIELDHKKENKTLYNELEIMDQHIMSVSLNGYKVEEPLGMKTKSVEMNMIVSYSQKFFLDKIRKVISETFHHTPVSFSSFILASYFAVRDKYISPDSYLLVDVGGEMTEVGIVSKGILKASLSFPFGKKTFFKYMYTKLEIELRDAQELFDLYSEGHLTPGKRKKVEELLKSIEGSWGESLRQSIANLPHILALPSTIFLTADSDLIKWFTQVINNEKFIQSMTIEHKCTVVPLTGAEFIKMCKIQEGVEYDPFLMIEAISITRKNKELYNRKTIIR